VTPPTPRAPRRDAQRNRERILAAAREVVAERGVAARMDEVARRAGVGVGTLYRFMPTKEALFGSILREEMERLERSAQRALERPEGEPALRAWLVEEAGQANRAFINILAARDPAEPVPELLSRRLRATLRRLVRRAQRSGELRDDVGAADVLMVLLACARVSEGTAAAAPGYARRFLALQLDALTPSDTRLPGRPLTERQLELALDALARSRRL
jgi:AcrR family transcriptional regulator